MKPDWDKLGDKYKDSNSVVIGDVDCTADNAKALCQKFGVRGYPTIKSFTGNPKGDDYQGGRKFADLDKFVTENMGPQCSPDNRDVCSEEELKLLDEKASLSKEALDSEIEELDGQVKKKEEDLQAFIKDLQSQYETALKEKDALVAELSPKIRLLRAVAKSKGAGKDEL